MENLPKNQTVAFTGHRTVTNPAELYTRLQNTVQQLYDDGKCVFLSGMAVGFDMMAAEAVLNLQKMYPDVQLIAVIPFVGQENCFNDNDKIRYHQILELATQKIILHPQYFDGIYLRRNDYLVDNSTILVAHYNGGARSGTAYTVRRAQSLKRSTLFI